MACAIAGPAAAGNLPAPVAGDFTLRDFHFAKGESVSSLRLHWTTLGTPHKDGRGHVTNAVLLLHDTLDSGSSFLAPSVASALFEPGKPLDVTRYYLVMPDAIGAGRSSKPSDGLHDRFPHYGTIDQVEAQYRLVTEALGIDHLSLVMGTAEGGREAWIWGERHPETMDGLVPIAAIPTAPSGRDALWRQSVIDAIRGDPDWHDGRFTVEPKLWRHILPLAAIMTNNAVQIEALAPDPATAASLESRIVEEGAGLHADDVLRAYESTLEANPGFDLRRIKAPVLAIAFADDLTHPIELGLVAAAVRHLDHGTAILVPASGASAGLATVRHPEIFAKNLGYFLRTLPLPERS